MQDMMLKTPTAMDAEIGSPKSEPKSGDSGCLAQEIMGGYAVILPTPTAMDSTEATARMKSSQTKDGSMHSVTLARAVHTLLPTPVASDSKGGVSCVQGARAERPGLLTLADMGFLCLLPTPLAVSVRHPGRVSELRMAGDVTFCSMAVGETRPNVLEDWLQFHGLMPSPVAQDYRRRGPNSRQQGLPELCHKLLPTPVSLDFKQKGPNARKQGLPGYFHDLLHTPIADNLNKRTNGQRRMTKRDFGEMFPENAGSQDSKDGRASQLNPLFVGEMMGYPLEWLTSPFLLGDGEGRP